jgi:translation initiation factor IF-3
LIKRYKRKPDPRFLYKTNDRITAPTLRVLDSEGKMVGVLSRMEALGQARDLGLDLVEIAGGATPPVVKIIDFKKFLYQQEKKKREEKRKSKVSETKEVRLGPFMDDHDLNVRIGRARDFLQSGDKVRLVVRFKGRQITHPEFGQKVLQKSFDLLSNVSKVDKEPRFEGKQLVAILTPEKKKQNEKENQEISTQTV